mmetsp:Transcript_27545/g.34087  ORF Transcript_27545/g.34087 Transcript_27545/m.34087 type:complete len:85 (-) Transcript_27545:406-660(-)
MNEPRVIFSTVYNPFPALDINDVLTSNEEFGNGERNSLCDNVFAMKATVDAEIDKATIFQSMIPSTIPIDTAMDRNVVPSKTPL